MVDWVDDWVADPVQSPYGGKLDFIEIKSNNPYSIPIFGENVMLYVSAMMITIQSPCLWGRIQPGSPTHIPFNPPNRRNDPTVTA